MVTHMVTVLNCLFIMKDEIYTKTSDFSIRKVVDRILNNKKDIIDDKEKSNPFIHHERIPINTSE